MKRLRKGIALYTLAVFAVLIYSFHFLHLANRPPVVLSKPPQPARIAVEEWNSVLRRLEKLEKMNGRSEQEDEAPADGGLKRLR